MRVVRYIEESKLERKVQDVKIKPVGDGKEDR